MQIPDEALQSLRRQAEAVAAREQPRRGELSDEELHRRLHESLVRQAEVELQNQELQRLLKDLERSNHQYLQLFDQSPTGNLVLDEAGLIRHANDTFCQNVGRTCAQVLAQPFFDFIDPRDKDAFLAGYDEFWNNPKNKTREVRLRGAPGWIYHARIRGAKLTDDANQPCLLVNISDITEHVRGEDALRKSESKFHSVIEQSADAIILTDENGRVIEWNRSAERLFGLSAADVLGQFLWNIQYRFTPEEKQTADGYERLRSLLQLHLETGQGALLNTLQETEIQLADGSRRILQGNAFSLPSENGFLLGSINRDVTDLKRTENILLARLRLEEYSIAHSLDELMQRMMDEICALSESPIGFFHFLQEDQRTLLLQAWSTYTVEGMCTAEGQGHAYDISEAGVWVDCIHERRVVIHNDYSALPHRKGMPEGHARVDRELLVPVFRGERIVAIVGVGNKARDYNDQDADMVERLADFAWDIIERKRTEQALQEHVYALGERVKELNCMYRLSDLIEQAGLSLTGILQESVKLIPPAMQYPESACAHITYQDQEYSSCQWGETPWMMCSHMVVDGEPVGVVEMAYKEQKPEADDGPFLKEERALLEAIAARLGRLIDRWRTTEKLQAALEENRRLLLELQNR